jgi:hypothetical protein
MMYVWEDAWFKHYTMHTCIEMLHGTTIEGVRLRQSCYVAQIILKTHHTAQPSLKLITILPQLPPHQCW